jgi:hypothetical protein
VYMECYKLKRALNGEQPSWANVPSNALPLAHLLRLHMGPGLDYTVENWPGGSPFKLFMAGCDIRGIDRLVLFLGGEDQGGPLSRWRCRVPVLGLRNENEHALINA